LEKEGEKKYKALDFQQKTFWPLYSSKGLKLDCSILMLEEGSLLLVCFVFSFFTKMHCFSSKKKEF
jgi:hypothetical protein